MKKWRSPHDGKSQGLHRKRNALMGAIALSLLAFAGQLVGSWFTGSLALLGDTAHLFTDLFSLSLSLVALLLSQRPSTNGQSYGLYRLEVLAAFLNGILLFVVGIGLGWEAIERLMEPRPVLALPLLFVSAGGLLLNLASAFFLSRALKEGDEVFAHHHHHHGHDEHDHHHEHHHHNHHHNHDHAHSDRNLRSAMLHVLSDALSSVAVMIGALTVHFTGWAEVDAILAIGLSLLILNWSVRVLRDSGHVLIEGTPKHIDIEKVSKELKAVDQRIAEVHDLHVWEITSRMYAATAEVKVDGMTLLEAETVRSRMNHVLREKFGIAHAVLAIGPR